MLRPNEAQTRLFLRALSGSSTTRPADSIKDRNQLKDDERYVLEVLARHRQSPIKHAAFLVNVMRADQRL